MKTYFTTLALIIALSSAHSVFAHTKQPTCTFSATPSIIPFGVNTPVVFTWSSANATSVSFSPAIVPSTATSGSYTAIIPGKPVLITLTAPGKAGSTATCTASISTVSHTPPD